MNKRRVEELIPSAIDALNNKNCNIQEKSKDENNAITFNGKIKKAYRSQISSFGAAVTMGSFKAAVAFFVKDADGKSGIKRSELIRTVYYIIKKDWKSSEDIFREISQSDQDEAKMKEDFLNASVALKLAFNAFDLIQ